MEAKSKRHVPIHYLPTLYCPQNCIYCYANVQKARERDLISLDRIKVILEELAAIGVESIQFSGGDALARPGIFGIIECIYRLGMVADIPTKIGLGSGKARRLKDIWKRHCAEVIGAGKLSFEEIAYSNCLPWRTGSKSNFADEVADNALKFYALPLIQELTPRVIVAMGKRAAAILETADREIPEVITWTRAQAATESVKRERVDSAARILSAVGR
jgi:organic radical activating enzyme